ncbi:ABC transporter substrate-binding protein [Salinactinospora qingdaonensis]|uniref:SsuA/THI5-like domain-containing protein n=1 Tax=Salinactinospora qingdaonensis TaxID=702744 RepID=A0ABP7FW47_9ACTN
MRRKIFVLASALALLATSACGGSSDSGDSGGDGQAEGELTEVTVGLIPIVDVAPVYLGQEQGYFEDHGLKLNIENASGGAAIVPGVVSGNFEFGFSNITSLLIGRQEDLPLKVVSNGVTSTGEQGADFGGIVVPEGSPVTDASGLAGKKVAVNTLQNIGDTTVRNSVRVAGGDPDEIKFVELPFPEMPAALENGQVDGAWLVEPFLSQSLNNGATEVASNFVDASPSLSVAQYFTSEQLANEDPELVESFRTAMHESMAYADANPEDVRRVLTNYTEIDQNLIEQIRLPHFPPEVNRESVQTIADLMVEDGLVDSQPDLEALYYE